MTSHRGRAGKKNPKVFTFISHVPFLQRLVKSGQRGRGGDTEGRGRKEGGKEILTSKDV